MRRILYHLLGGAFLLFLTGCTPGNETNIPTDHLDKNILAIEKAMRIDTLETFDSLIYAKEFLVYQDSILIAVNNKYENGYFVEVYKWPSMVPIKQLYRLGDGPDEMLGAKVSLNKNELIVNDYVKSQVAVVNIDSMLKNPDFSPLPIRHQAIGSPTAIPYRGKFLLENPYSFTDRKARIIQEAPRFYPQRVCPEGLRRARVPRLQSPSWRWARPCRKRLKVGFGSTPCRPCTERRSSQAFSNRHFALA